MVILAKTWGQATDGRLKGIDAWQVKYEVLGEGSTGEM
jgi:hypothetical protein